MANRRDQKTIKVLTFLLNEEMLAVPVSDITEVNRVTGWKTVPKAPDCVIGMINCHGRTTAMLNLKKLLNADPSHLARNAMWFGADHGTSFACFAVDAFLGFIDIPGEKLDEMPALAEGPETDHIKCYARLDDALVQVIDIKNIMGAREREFLETVGGKDGGN